MGSPDLPTAPLTGCGFFLDISGWCGTLAPMSVRMRHTSSHTRNRRSHHALKNRKLVKDKESGALRLPHRLDETTGMYRGKLIAAPKGKKIQAAEKPVVADKPIAKAEKKTGSKGRAGKSAPKADAGA